MTFDAFETGDGRPVELYDFFSSGIVLRRTNAMRDQTFGNVYEALAGLSRTEPTMNEEITAGEMEVIVPKDFPVATQFRFTLPSILPTLTVFRVHLSDTDEEVFTVWKGEIISAKFGDNTAKLFCQPVTRIFDKVVPNRVFSATCNWQLYARGCQVVRGLYTKTTTIAAADSTGQILTITNARILAGDIDTDEGLGLTSAELDIFWNRGIVAILGSPGERRAVVEADIGGDPDVMRINRPFILSGLAGTSVEIVAGCNHNLNEDCTRKFLNTPNFGGFPTVPLKNPFQIELDGAGTTNAQPKKTTPFGGPR